MTKYNERMKGNAVVALAPVSGDAVAHEVVGTTIDLNDWNSCTFVLMLGTLAAGGSATWAIYEDDDPTMATEALCSDVAVPPLIEQTLDIAPHAVTDADDGKTYAVSYIGNKRYVRMKLTTVGAFAKDYAGIAFLGHNRANQHLPPDPAP
jgi:hypothetical protein